MKNYVIEDYKEWLFEQVDEDRPIKRASYTKLLGILFDIPFIYVHEYDYNRMIDGEELRNIYIYDGGDEEISKWNGPCTVLEVLIALAFKMQQMTDNPDIYYSVGYWFWVMIYNLDLDDMTNSYINKHKVLNKINTFMNRKYEYNGEGGNIFVISNTNEDLREMEIWHQMCRFLNDYL